MASGIGVRCSRIHVAQVVDVAMNLNFDPFWRSSIGFDRLLDLMDESLRYQPESNSAVQHPEDRRE
jgi:hypothetical protein